MDPHSYSKEELLATVEEMNKQILKLESLRGESKWLEGALKERTHALSERTKEMDCLHGLLQLGQKYSNPLASGAEKILQVIKTGWQFPEVTCARIHWDGFDLKTLDFGSARALQSEPIMVKGVRRGEVEVGYTVDKPAAFQGPFLKEEAKLLRSIALWLGMLLTSEL